MKVINTNALVRYVTADDPIKTSIAERVIAEGVLLTLTVLLETGWVLSSRYGFDRLRLAATILRLIEAPMFFFEDEATLTRAIELYRDGADWDDAIHLAAARGSAAFVTFDRTLAKIEGSPVPIELAGV